MTTTTAEIEALAPWGPAKEINTKRGPRLLRKASITPTLEAAWKDHRPDLAAAGISLSQDRYTGKWEFCWWQPIPEEQVLERAQAVEASRATSADVDLPRPAGLDYLPFQKASIYYALTHPNVLIGDEMGLGKTIQAIGIINSDPSIETVVIICPKTLKGNWAKELRKWLARPMTVGVADATWPGTQIVILNYERLKKWHGRLTEKVWGCLVIDEAHLLKNSKTQRSIYSLGQTATRSHPEEVPGIKATRRVFLTGTPIVNRPAELYNIIRTLHPRWETMGFFAFAKRYANAHHNGFGWDFSGAQNLPELQIKLRETILIRRLKADVLTELPAKIRQVIEMEPETAEQRAAVAADREMEEEQDARKAVILADKAAAEAAGDEDAFRAAVRALQAAQQIAFEEMARRRHETAVAKVPSVVEYVQGIMEDDDAKKVIIAAHHHDVIAGLAAGLADFNPVTVTGEVAEKDRLAAVEAFQTEPTVRVFLAGIQAAGVGITLTASSTVVFAELDWVPGNVSQMEDRAHRIGQTDTVLVYHLVLAGSIDARMAQVIVEKQEAIDKALDRKPAPAPVTVAPAPAARPEEPEPAIKEPADYFDGYEAAHGLPEPVRASTAPAPAAAAPAAPEYIPLTPEQVAAVHEGLRLLAGLDTDHAQELNGQGFNKMDGLFGHSLASAYSLTQKQAYSGHRLIRKYRRQLPASLLRAAGIIE